MGETIIYDTTYQGPFMDEGYSATGFTATDPISGSTQEMQGSGVLSPDSPESPTRNERAGLGTAIPSTAPTQTYTPNYGRGSYAGSAGHGCIVDGFQFGPGECTRLFGSSSGYIAWIKNDPEPNNVRSGVFHYDFGNQERSNDDRKQVPQRANFDDEKFKNCVKELFNTEVGSYEIGKSFDGRSPNTMGIFDYIVDAITGGDSSRFTVTTEAIHSAQLSYMVGGVIGTAGNITFGWTYSDSTGNALLGRSPNHNYIASDWGGPEFQQAAWVYELGNALGYITNNRPPVSDPSRYENVSKYDPEDIGGALMDCVFGGAVDPTGKVKPPQLPDMRLILQ